jgi:hypothetical protein
LTTINADLHLPQARNIISFFTGLTLLHPPLFQLFPLGMLREAVIGNTDARHAGD